MGSDYGRMFQTAALILLIVGAVAGAALFALAKFLFRHISIAWI